MVNQSKKTTLFKRDQAIQKRYKLDQKGLSESKKEQAMSKGTKLCKRKKKKASRNSLFSIRTVRFI